MKKILILICCVTCIVLQTKSQVFNKNVNYDSLLVNTWQTKSVKIDGKEIKITEAQKNSRIVFHKNHTSENKTDDLTERGEWSIDKANMTLKVTVDLLPLEEPVMFKIISLTSVKFIFSINNEEGKTIIFTTVPAKT